MGIGEEQQGRFVSQGEGGVLIERADALAEERFPPPTYALTSICSKGQLDHKEAIVAASGMVVCCAGRTGALCGMASVVHPLALMAPAPVVLIRRGR